MIFRSACLVFLVVALAGPLAMSSQKDPNQGKEDHASRVQSLLKQRRDVLSGRAEVIATLLKLQKASQTDLIDARDDLFAADFDLAQSAESRIEALKSRVENLKKGEEYFIALKAQAKGTEAEVLAAKARRLLVEIQLERLLESSSTQ